MNINKYEFISICMYVNVRMYICMRICKCIHISLFVVVLLLFAAKLLAVFIQAPNLHNLQKSFSPTSTSIIKQIKNMSSQFEQLPDWQIP